MEGKPYNAASANRIYEELEASEEWAREEAYDTLMVYIPGFRKENLRIQVTSSRNIRVLGERPLGHDNKWQRIRKEFPIPSNCDTNDISAKFESGILYVKLPKMIAPVVETKDKLLKPPKEEAFIKPPPKEEALIKPPTEALIKQPKEEAFIKPPPKEEALIKPPKEALIKPPKEEALIKPLKEEALIKPISTTSEPQKSKKSNESSEAVNANYLPPRTTEKEPNTQTSKVSSSSSSSTSNRVEAEGAQKKTSGGTESSEKLEDDDGAKRAEYKRAIFGQPQSTNNAGGDKSSSSTRPQGGYSYCTYNKQVFGGLVMEMKQQPRKMLKLGLAFFFLLLLGLYAKRGINSSIRGGFKGDDEL